MVINHNMSAMFAQRSQGIQDLQFLKKCVHRFAV